MFLTLIIFTISLTNMQPFMFMSVSYRILFLILFRYAGIICLKPLRDQLLNCYDNLHLLSVCENFCRSFYLSHLMGKPTICIGENKGADQLHGNREADQRLCFRYTDGTLPLLPKSEISSF